MHFSARYWSHLIFSAIAVQVISTATIAFGASPLTPIDLPPFAKDGIMQPPSHYQRYRRPEYPKDKPFYQWWYFNVKDVAHNRYFAFSYGMLDCVNNEHAKGSSISFFMHDLNQGTVFSELNGLPLAGFTATNDFDIAIKADPSSRSTDYELNVLDDDTYQIRGKMRHDLAKFMIDGTYQNQPVPKDIPVEWNLTFHRIYGWYGEHDFENNLRVGGVIGWNTYAHDTEVEGYVTVAGVRYDIERNVNFRGYGDSNWGVNFPDGNPSIDYPWGWYSVVVPAEDPADDLSIIVGTGKMDSQNAFGIMEGNFADIRLDKNSHIGIRQSIALKQGPNGQGVPIISSSNVGKVKKFEVTRDDWSIFKDSLGAHQVPLHQRVDMEVEGYAITLDYFSQLKNYFRLIVAHENYIFSDFEGLGVRVHVVVQKRWIENHYAAWDVKKLFPTPVTQSRVMRDFWSNQGGIEYGYRTDDVKL